MISRFTDLERKTILVQFIAVEPLAFYTTSDGTDLVQDSLRLHLTRSDADIFGQEGSLSIDEQGEFLTFEPLDTKNRTLHLPIEHLAYCGALRRMRHDPSDQRDIDQIHKREFENVDLANRFAHYIVGPPVFTAVFHGFDNALCYIFVTQSADDACLLVMKLMRAFKSHEQKIEQQGQRNQGHLSLPPFSSSTGSPLPVDIRRESPLLQSSQGFLTDNRQSLSSPFVHQAPTTTINSYNQDPRQDEIIQRLLANPNLELVSQSTPFASQRVDDIPILSAPLNMNQQSSPNMFNNIGSSSSNIPLMSRSSNELMRPPSPPILGIPNSDNYNQSLSLGNTNPQVIYKPNNQEVVYKQNIMVRWLQPPTPPPPAPIIIREVQAPVAQQPPLVCRQMPAQPRTPPPIIIREKPPPCPPVGQPVIIEKRMPPICVPRQVIVERYPEPPPKPPTIIYEKYLPQTQQTRPVFVKREICRPASYPVVQQQVPARQIIREVVRQNPQISSTTQPAFLCVPQQQQQQIIATQPQTVQQLVPMFAAQQNIVQPQGVRIIRQVIGPSQTAMHQPQQIYSTTGSPMIQAVPSNILQ